MVTPLALLTAVHTALSIVGIGAGMLAILRLNGHNVSKQWVPVFLFLAWTTSLTGYLFPFNGFTPAIGTGIFALGILALVFVSEYHYKLAGRWQSTYAAGMVASVYLLVFVAIAQAFLKVPCLKMLAPTGTEPPFAIAQGTNLALFIVIGIITVRRFKTIRRID